MVEMNTNAKAWCIYYWLRKCHSWWQWDFLLHILYSLLFHLYFDYISSFNNKNIFNLCFDNGFSIPELAYGRLFLYIFTNCVIHNQIYLWYIDVVNNKDSLIPKIIKVQYGPKDEFGVFLTSHFLNSI